MREKLEYLVCCFCALVLLPLIETGKFVAEGMLRLYLVTVVCVLLPIGETLKELCEEEEQPNVSELLYRPVDEHVRIISHS